MQQCHQNFIISSNFLKTPRIAPSSSRSYSWGHGVRGAAEVQRKAPRPPRLGFEPRNGLQRPRYWVYPTIPVCVCERVQCSRLSHLGLWEQPNCWRTQSLSLHRWGLPCLIPNLLETLVFFLRGAVLSSPLWFFILGLHLNSLAFLLKKKRQKWHRVCVVPASWGKNCYFSFKAFRISVCFIWKLRAIVAKQKSRFVLGYIVWLDYLIS